MDSGVLATQRKINTQMNKEIGTIPCFAKPKINSQLLISFVFTYFQKIVMKLIKSMNLEKHLMKSVMLRS